MPFLWEVIPIGCLARSQRSFHSSISSFLVILISLRVPSVSNSNLFIYPDQSEGAWGLLPSLNRGTNHSSWNFGSLMPCLMPNLNSLIIENNNVIWLSQKSHFDVARRVAVIDAPLLADILWPDFILLLGSNHCCVLSYLLMRVPLKVL